MESSFKRQFITGIWGSCPFSKELILFVKEINSSSSQSKDYVDDFAICKFKLIKCI
jgi:hypothetical protein